MQYAELVRSQSTGQGTFGRLTFDGQRVSTLELPWRDNLPQRSCIPVGRYLCRLVQSPKFGRVYMVTDVPGRSAVLIHSANVAGDVDLGYTTQLHGCIAPHMLAGVMRNASGVLQAAGLVSRPALRMLMTWAMGKDFDLEIT